VCLWILILSSNILTELNTPYGHAAERGEQQRINFNARDNIDYELRSLLELDSFVDYLQNPPTYTDNQAYLFVQHRCAEIISLLETYRLLPLSETEQAAINTLEQIIQKYVTWIEKSHDNDLSFASNTILLSIPFDMARLSKARQLLEGGLKQQKHKTLHLEIQAIFAFLVLFLFFPVLLVAATAICFFIKKSKGYQSKARALECFLEIIEIESENNELNNSVQLQQEFKIKQDLLQELKLSSSVFESNEAIIITDTNLYILKVNQAFTHLTGYSSEEVLGQHIRLLKSGLQESQFYQNLWKILIQTGQFKGQVIDSKKDGELFTANLSIIQVYNSEGKVEIYLAHLSNITAYKKSQAALNRRLNIEALIAEIVVNVLSAEADELEAVINQSVFFLGKELGVDRSYLFTVSEDLNTISNSYEWCSSQTESMIKSLQLIDFEDYPWLKQQLMNQKVISIDNVEKMPIQALAEQIEFKREQAQSVLIIPIVIKGKKLIGFFGFDLVHRKRKWRSEDISLFRIVADVFYLSHHRHNIEQENSIHLERTLAVLSENSALLVKNRELTLRMIQSQEQERRFLAQELHDEIGQLVTGMRLDTAYLKGLEQLQGDEEVLKVLNGMYDLSARMITSLRLTTRRIRSAALDQLGLVPALEELILDWQTHNRTVQIEMDLLQDLPPINEITMMTFYRAAQEALTNISKYSQAKHVKVLFVKHTLNNQEYLELSICDNGIGFDVKALQSSVKGIGLLGMQERVTALSGDFKMTSCESDKSGKGTKITISIPLLNNVPLK